MNIFYEQSASNREKLGEPARPRRHQLGKKSGKTAQR
jgi:hypothetical protein